MRHLLFYLLLLVSTSTLAVQFSSNAQQEQQLWNEQIDLFLKQNPKAQLFSEGDIQGLFVPSPKPTAQLLILSSGIHGAEAMAGGTLQRLLLQNWLAKPKNVNLLIFHAINPAGYKQFRRTNPNNVDLNRNFFIDALPNNPAYQKMQSLLEPQGPVSTSTFSKWSFFLKVGLYYVIHGKKAILNTLSGQSHSPTGLYYSSTENQTETKIVQNKILQVSKDFSTILHIDLHTGFGERGKLHFFGCDEFRSPQQIKWQQEIFPDVKVDTANDKDFYLTHGDFVDWTWKALPNKKVIPMVFEFGTKNSQTLLGGMESLWISVIENQGYHFGYKTDADKQKTLALFESLFNPQDEDWQKNVLVQGELALEEAIARLEAGTSHN